MTPDHTPRLIPADAADPSGDSLWEAQWARVPDQWRQLRYRIDQAPADRVFLLNRRYLRNPDGHDFTPQSVPLRLQQELAWWVWLCGADGLRKIEPSLLRWFSLTLTAAVADYQRVHGDPPTSVTDLGVADLTRSALVGFEQRNARLASANSRRNITNFIEQMHLHVSVRCGTKPWWEHDIWDLRADRRIPQREHEPAHDRALRLDTLEPRWLRDGVRFWLRTALSTELLRWSSAVERARTLSRLLGPFLQAQGIDDPVISTDPAVLRQVFTDFSGYLHSPQACARPGRLLSASAVDEARSQTQVFYTFMADHAPEAAAATGDRRWLAVSAAHTRLWGPAFRTRHSSRVRELTWYSTSELQQMLCYLDVLSADRGFPVSITHPDRTLSVVAGLGDPQTARIWLLQALTGRRASEILMLDHEPLEAIPGIERPVDSNDPDAFVAKLRYQQTKVDGVIPTILVEQAVVNIIAEQQQYNRDHYPDLTPKYLFLGVRHQFQGQRPRPYASYRSALAKLDRVHGLTDSAGNPLRFTQTHRLRHTRATELLNDGVPIHVVQRYLGHASPEMTLRYAATLAATAEAEFLKHKKIGAHGADLGISPTDVYDMTQLSQRTDRVLPNGVCLLPPLQTCDKGNACLTCGHFATDRTHLDELADQRTRTESLLQVRRRQYHERTGRQLSDENVWVHERLREIASLDAIIARLAAEEDQASADRDSAVAGAGTSDRRPLLQIQTRGLHEIALGKAENRGNGV
ncbi:tyrosine-type recombinase/integrase [Gordonia sihwensis]|uniref:tyrosine-type recombinase/integrase n=1 Tax=Gordonia TaxID=2053 RepID=UPI002417567B|nr:tyrosine-type recombinase/integrase [Gordonia sihwensis]WFN92524.1 tyrosine-type recombinase/integrase [Gordonia sihwensis]